MNIRVLPPLTGTPLDYVPIGAPVREKKRPVVFSAPVIRRSVVAALAMAAFMSVFFVPSLGVGTVALAAMYGFVWAGNKVGDWLNAREAARGTAAITTPASWWPDPFSWVPALLALAIIIAAIYFS